MSAYDDIISAQNLSDALNGTTDSGVGAAYVNGGNVVLLQDVQLNYTINITASSPITLTANESNDFMIYRDFSDEYLFNVSSGTFILKGETWHNLTIDGNKDTYSDDGASLIYVHGGTFTMRDWAVLQNSNTSSFEGAAGCMWTAAARSI